MLQMCEHVEERFKMLDCLIQHGGIQSVEMDFSMGTGAARDQWIAAKFTSDQHTAFVKKLQQHMTDLSSRHPQVVVLKAGGLQKEDWVDFRSVSMSNIRVWAANTGNHDRPPGIRGEIAGYGQADGIRKQLHGQHVAGLFSVVTTPVQGIPQSYTPPWWWPIPSVGAQGQ